MKKKFFPILGVAVLVCSLFTGQHINAQIYGQFETIDRYNYPGTFNIPASEKTAIPEDKFVLPPNNQPDIELNDGYYELPLGFTYRYNGADYDKVWISINGFLTFDQPPSLVEISRDPTGLFRIDNSTPNNVVAPFWGDHKYREKGAIKNGFAETTISYKPGTYEIEDPLDPSGQTIITRKTMLIEWKNLNVCYNNTTEVDPVTNELIPLKGNVYSFQVIIYQGANDIDSKQGDIEFRYGEFGPLQEQIAVDPGLKAGNAPAAIGFKGAGFGLGNKADFFNAIYNGGEEPIDRNSQMVSTKLSTMKPTSGDPKLSVRAYAIFSMNEAERWGDGDADMSKAPGGRHFKVKNLQNMYVNINDARIIMKSLVTGNKLDSAYGNAAYHADVHHDGRYYYLVKRNMNNAMTIVTEGYQASDINGPIFDDNGHPVMSKDTFFIKAAKEIGGFGFLPYYGQNDNTMTITFPGENIQGGTITILDADKPESDYKFLVARIKDTDIQYVEVDTVSNRLNMEISLKKRVNWRNQNITEELPVLLTNYRKELLWEADEQDAALIISYLGAKIPQLPWIYDNVFHIKGKIGADVAKSATNIKFDNIVVTGVNTYKVPVYINGVADGPMSAKFKLNSDIINFESADPDVFVDFSNDTRIAVIAASGSFDENSPIAYLTISTDNDQILANEVRFDGNNVSNVKKQLKTNLAVADFDVLAQNTPNPVVNSTNFTLNILEEGNYSLVVVDVFGNIVKTIVDANMNPGTFSYTWDCKNENGEKVANGTYIYRLIGNGHTLTKSLVIAK